MLRRFYWIECFVTTRGSQTLEASLYDSTIRQSTNLTQAQQALISSR